MTFYSVNQQRMIDCLVCFKIYGFLYNFNIIRNDFKFRSQELRDISLRYIPLKLNCGWMGVYCDFYLFFTLAKNEIWWPTTLLYGIKKTNKYSLDGCVVKYICNAHCIVHCCLFKQNEEKKEWEKSTENPISLAIIFQTMKFSSLKTWQFALFLLQKCLI